MTNGSKKHRDRLADLGRFRMPERGTAAWAEFEARLAESGDMPEPVRDWVERQWKKTSALNFAQLSNGADLSADTTLREFLREYQARVIRHGLASMPSSFNGLEAFVSYLPSLVTFRLWPEKDHLFSWVDFVDHYTSRSDLSEPEEDLSAIPEHTIFNYTNLDPPEDLTFSSLEGPTVAVQAVSLIRHGAELTVLLTGGLSADLQEEGRRHREAVEKSGQSFRPYLEKVEAEIEAVRLGESDGLWRTIAAARFDLEDRTQNARYLLRDFSDSYLVHTDDPSTFLASAALKSEVPETVVEDAIRRSAEVVEKFQTIYELCAVCLHLPSYFEDHSDLIAVERRETRYRKELKKAPRDTKRLIPGAERVAFRSIDVFRPPRARGRQPHRAVVAPDFRIEKSGYWKQLDPGTTGKDKHGRPVTGRTWVTKQLTWIEEKADSLTLSTDPQPLPPGSDPGWIYLIRSAAHPLDVFKVGLTRRSADERAAELSRHSGAPDKFHVLVDWPVGDCAAAEKAIHEALEPFRINPDREFFELPMREAVGLIGETLDSLRE